MLASASAQAPMTLEQEVDGMQEQVIQEDTRKQAEELDLTNIASRGLGDVYKRQTWMSAWRG